MVWIYRSSTFILCLAKEKKNQSINTKIITDKYQNKGYLPLYRETAN